MITSYLSISSWWIFCARNSNFSHWDNEIFSIPLIISSKSVLQKIPFNLEWLWLYFCKFSVPLDVFQAFPVFARDSLSQHSKHACVWCFSEVLNLPESDLRSSGRVLSNLNVPSGVLMWLHDNVSDVVHHDILPTPRLCGNACWSLLYQLFSSLSNSS